MNRPDLTRHFHQLLQCCKINERNYSNQMLNNQRFFEIQKLCAGKFLQKKFGKMKFQILEIRYFVPKKHLHAIVPQRVVEHC
jgi:hypothetical protein